MTENKFGKYITKFEAQDWFITVKNTETGKVAIGHGAEIRDFERAEEFFKENSKPYESLINPI